VRADFGKLGQLCKYFNCIESERTDNAMFDDKDVQCMQSTRMKYENENNECL